ncbi:TonB-dependent receptor [Lentisalinibacter sediminis]|uniref:TonB-dependent receptor n=1 Tax=Lentisalinibacter sediminis TaxID=2992237 RepID=UPI003868BFC0
MRTPLPAAIAALAIAATPTAWPDTSSGHGAVAETALEEIVVYGRARELIGTADTASEGLVGYDDIQLPPLLRVGELVEAVPGMVATQHSGTGKANQYFLRGFNLDHGTDFSVSAEGVPLNMPTHGHGQGYLDLNFLIPELVATTRYRKGPYAAETGDFSSAGSVDFTFYDELPETLLGLTTGEHGYGRALAAGSSALGAGTLTAAFDATVYDGPWELEENLQQYKAFLSYGFELSGASAELNVQAYDSEWDATDQIPLRAVESGLIDRLSFIDPDLGGQTERYALSGALDFGTWQARAYVVDYDFTLYSNFTYFLDDPVEGDEFEQRDDRTIYGASVEGGRGIEFGRRLVEFRYGADLRYDDIDEVGLYGTATRVRTDVVRQDAVEELSVGLWGEADVELTRSLRGILGLRADYYDWEVDAFRADNGGSGDDSLVSPKLGLAWRVSDGLVAYASWGRGFHSNDVRGATIVTDPASGEPVNPVDVLVESEGGELGLRYERGTRFNATLVGFWLELDSELVYVGDAGTTEPNDATERLGVEASAFWQATDWLAVNAAWTATDAEFKQDQGGGREIPGAVESTFTLGLNAVWANGFSASTRVRYLDDAPLVEDGSVRSDGSLLLNAGVAWRQGMLELRLDAFNLLDSDDDDIAYFYESLLPGEAAPVGDIHFHPLEPRTIRASATLHWR